MPSVLSGEHMSEIRELSAGLPIGEAAEAIEQVDQIWVTGVMAIGKDSTMALSGIAKAQGFTDRPRRPGEVNSYRFYPNASEQQKSLIAGLRGGSVIQIGIGPTNYIYGLEPVDFAGGGPHAKDVFASTAIDFRRYPFRSQQAVCLVDNLNGWFARFRPSRGDVPENKARLLRDVAELGVALDDPDFIFLENPTDGQEVTGAQLARITRGETMPERQQAAARRIGARLHFEISDLLGLPAVHPVS